MASIDPLQSDVAHGMAARAHRIAHEGLSDKRIAGIHGVSRRTANRWEHQGPPQLTHYAANSPFKYSLISYLKASGMEQIREEPRAELVAKTRALLCKEKHTEGADNGNDMTRGMNMLDRAAQKLKDAAIEEELAARFVRCAELRIPESEIFG